MTSPALVFVVDDDPAMRETLVAILALNGVTARGYETGSAALAAAHGADGPALALLDQRLPDMTGIELAAALKAHDSDLAVVLLTGYASAENAIAAVGVVDAYLTKPVQPDELLRNLRTGVERTQLRRANRALVARLQDMNFTLEVAVAERTRELQVAHRKALADQATRDEATHARDSALQASQFKSRLLANMNHEIRTPMNGVLGMAQLLSDSRLDADQRAHLALLHASGLNLMAIVDTILDFSKLEGGNLELEDDTFDLPAVMQNVITPLGALAHNKGLAIALDVAADVPTWVRGDPARLGQIVTNLVDNAIKFTSTGRIDIAVTTAGRNQIGFRIADTGIGIDVASQPGLFEPFFQADTSSTRPYGGTGLGLALCRQLVELMGGALTFESQPRQGTTFQFAVTLTAARPGITGPVRDASSDQVADHRNLSPTPRALLVEDLKVNQLVATAMLKRLGYQVDLADDGNRAVQAVQSSPYDVILMDCLMPIMDGYEATTRIRDLEGPASHIHIIALTAATTTVDRQKCLAAGMDDFLAKPINTAALKHALGKTTEASAHP